MENVVPEFPHVGNFGPEVFQLPPPLVHEPPHEISTTKFELEFKRASKTLLITSPSNVMSWSVLYCTVLSTVRLLYGTALPCIEVYCIVMYRKVLHCLRCTVMYCIVLCFNVLCCVALYCLLRLLLCGTALRCKVLYYTVLYFAVLCCAALFRNVLHRTVPWCTALTVVRCAKL